VQAPPPPTPTPTPTPSGVTPPPFVSAAFGPFGQVMELVTSAGVLMQFDASGPHVLGGGVRAASVSFLNRAEVLLVTCQTAGLPQVDAAGARLLAASGVQDASVTFGPLGEVIDVVFSTGQAAQFDASGVHALAGSFSSLSVGFFGGAEVLLATTTTGALVQF